MEFTLPHPALTDADWVDCYAVQLDFQFADAREAANAIVNSFPKWTYPALALRQIIVAPFGLKGGSDTKSKDVIGIFPVVSESTREIAAGIDDRHLDFRIIVRIADVETSQTSVTGDHHHAP